MSTEAEQKIEQDIAVDNTHNHENNHDNDEVDNDDDFDEDDIDDKSETKKFKQRSSTASSSESSLQIDKEKEEDEERKRKKREEAKELSEKDVSNLNPFNQQDLDTLTAVVHALRTQASIITRRQRELQRSNKVLKSEIDVYVRHTLPAALNAKTRRDEIDENKKQMLSGNKIKHQRTESGAWRKVEDEKNQPKPTEQDYLNERVAHSNDKVFRSGWMYKEGGLVHNWKRRLFILYGSSIEYYADVDDEKPKGTIHLDTCTVSPLQSRPGVSKPCMELIFGSKSRKWRFYAELLTDNKRWFSAIQNRVVTLGYLRRCEALKETPDVRIVEFLNNVPETAMIFAQMRQSINENRTLATSSSSSSSLSASRHYQTAAPETWPPSHPLLLNHLKLSLDAVSVVARILSDSNTCPGGGVSKLEMINASLTTLELEILTKALADSDFNAVDRNKKEAHLPRLALGDRSVYAPREQHGVSSINLSQNNFVNPQKPGASESAFQQLAQVLKVNTCLVELILDSCHIDDHILSIIALSLPLATCPLKRLVLSHNRITCVGAKILANNLKRGYVYGVTDAALPDVARMSIAETDIDTEIDGDRNERASISMSPSQQSVIDYQMIPDSARVHMIEELCLDHNQIGDDGAAALAQYLSIPQCSLLDLQLSHNCIGEPGFKQLALALRSNKKLSKLNLVRNAIDANTHDEHKQVDIDAQQNAARHLSHAAQINRSLTNLKFLSYELSENTLQIMRLACQFGFENQINS